MAAVNGLDESGSAYNTNELFNVTQFSAVDPGCVKILKFYRVQMRNCCPFKARSSLNKSVLTPV